MPRSRPYAPLPSRSRSNGIGLSATDAPAAHDLFIVGIGASAGGLDSCTRLVEALPDTGGMAFILVQHLDPTHESMMVGLLASHTGMTILQASNGMPIEPDHFYVIPPGAQLAVEGGALRLSARKVRRGLRLPFDYLLQSMAREYGARAACVILSGTGADGSVGLRAIKERGGVVIVQDPDEAGYDGMPRNAILTGLVDHVLPVARMPEALAVHAGEQPSGYRRAAMTPRPRGPEWLPEIIELLRNRTAHDFTFYKPGTLQRRIERRMAMASIRTGDTNQYLELLRGDSAELEVLAKDLLINVTNFFRDPEVFDLLTQQIVPDLVRRHVSDQPIRLWVAGCSTGEETYSLAMVFREEIMAAKRNIRLQVFASDVDADAIAAAREGYYPETIEEDVSAERLARFFSKEGHGYRVMPELRSIVVFTVQDVLADPPFSRLDLVSCRNLLIYLRPEAQAKIISLFHFALREGGLLLLGTSETIGGADDRFELVSKRERLYRHIVRARAGNLGFAVTATGSPRPLARPASGAAPSRQTALAELCRRLVMESYAPAAVLINSANECLYFLGPTDWYLQVAPGHPTLDLLVMARPSMRIKLRAAIQQATRENARVIVPGGRVTRKGGSAFFNLDVRPVASDGENLMLVCFVEGAEPQLNQEPVGTADSTSQVLVLTQELAAARADLEDALRNLETSSNEQKAINEEALSVNEEFQSTNEELLTSKEELQSLNEELTALNSQLQETLERQRTTSNDLQNVLYSTDVATLFLDMDLNIRFFTPATKSLFHVIPGDIGRPLADLSSLVGDADLLDDARAVLETLAPIEREIEGSNGICFCRRILPYRTRETAVEGVVITFTDITERKAAAKALEAAKRQAELANVAKSRFLAAASHDLRQPLQTLVLLQGLLSNTVEQEKARTLVARLEDALGAMSGMLNTLLDINQIEADTVCAEKVNFPVNDLLDRLRNEFTYHAHAQGLTLRGVASSLSINSDPRLLEQMMRNLLANALKYTQHGKVLLGCRRRGGTLSIEIWDTGIGIPAQELDAIFDEYHQIGNAGRERSRGLGLGLSIVRHLANVLGHQVKVRSWPGFGSVFSIEVKLQQWGMVPRTLERRHSDKDAAAAESHLVGTILVIEDDPEVCGLLEAILRNEGHHVLTAQDGSAGLALLAGGAVRPDLVLADYNLPNGMNGLQVCARLREVLHRQVPVIILTADISTDTLREIATQNCLRLNKPVKLAELTQAIQSVLAKSATSGSRRPGAAQGSDAAPEAPVIFVVDDDSNVRETLRAVLEGDGRIVEDYSNCEAFLQGYRRRREACLLVDAYLPGMSGLDLLRQLQAAGDVLPAIMITGYSDVPMAVQAMKAGASDFIEKPVGQAELLASIGRALEQARDTGKLAAWRTDAASHLAGLTTRQRQIMDMVLAGNPSKNIAADLGISQRTVENHRALIMKKCAVKSLPALARLALAAGSAANQADKGEGARPE